MAGRPAIARGDVRARSWWDCVRLSLDAPGGIYEVNDVTREQHWYWVREQRLIYGQWKTSGETPERVLFSELRPEEWDATPKPRRLTLDCDDAACINPWHYSIGTGAGGSSQLVKRSPLERDVEKPYDSLEKQASAADWANASRLYIRLLEDDDAWARLVDAGGNLRCSNPATTTWVMNELYIEETLPVALVANWLTMRPLMTLSEARELESEYTAKFQSEVAAKRAEVVSAREVARRG